MKNIFEGITVEELNKSLESAGLELRFEKDEIEEWKKNCEEKVKNQFGDIIKAKAEGK